MQLQTEGSFSNRIIAQQFSARAKTPFLTLAIPHYKQSRYLEIVLHSIFAQTFSDFEIVVSDDCSPDDSRDVIPQQLQRSGRPFRYYLQESNLGYDGNVRFCLATAQGQYVFLLGNDDALAAPTTLEEIALALHQLDLPAVAFVNFCDWGSGTVTERAQATQVLGSGVDVAIRHYRSFSFVSGLLYARAAATEHETARWDRSIYYQIYLASRIIAAGGKLAALNICAVSKDVRLNGETVPNYISKWSQAPWSFEPRHTGMDSVLRVTIDAILPHVSYDQRSQTQRRVINQIMSITYPYWLLEYRRVANWSFAVGIARSMWPSTLLAEYELTGGDRLLLWLIYLYMTTAGLVIPVGLFTRFRSNLANFLRRRQQLQQPIKQVV